MKVIYAAGGEEILVDDDDYFKVAKNEWIVCNNRGCRFAARNKKSLFRNSIRKTRVRLHRLIAGATGKARVAALNGNYLDCRKSNLVLVRAIGGVKPSTGTRGVVLADGRYRATIQVQGRRLSLGTFGTLEEASEAYERAMVEMFGYRQAEMERAFFQRQGKAEGAPPPRRDEQHGAEVLRAVG